MSDINYGNNFGNKYNYGNIYDYGNNNTNYNGLNLSNINNENDNNNNNNNGINPEIFANYIAKREAELHKKAKEAMYKDEKYMFNRAAANARIIRERWQEISNLIEKYEEKERLKTLKLYESQRPMLGLARQNAEHSNMPRRYNNTHKNKKVRKSTRRRRL